MVSSRQATKLQSRVTIVVVVVVIVVVDAVLLLLHLLLLLPLVENNAVSRICRTTRPVAAVAAVVVEKATMVMTRMFVVQAVEVARNIGSIGECRALPMKNKNLEKGRRLVWAERQRTAVVDDAAVAAVADDSRPLKAKGGARIGKEARG